MASSTPAWRRALAQRLRGWDRDAFAPLRVTLSAEEQQLHGSASSSIFAGFVRKDHLEVQYVRSVIARDLLAHLSR